MAGVSLALDWTPNTNHVGFYVAKALDFYTKSGLAVELLSPHIDNYSASPASKVASKTASMHLSTFVYVPWLEGVSQELGGLAGCLFSAAYVAAVAAVPVLVVRCYKQSYFCVQQTAFALGPSETVVSYHSPPHTEGRPKLVAVATCVQEDLSAIVTLKDSGIDRPKDLDGKTYASYGARFEGRIVQRLIQADGGKGDFIETTPEKLGIWNTLISGEADATWIFRGWEGIIAKMEGVDLNLFTLGDYGIPYGYTPVVMAHPDTLRDSPDLVRQFLAASAAGFEYAVANPEEAAALLIETATAENPGLPEPLLPAVVLASLELMGKHFISSGGRWGTMSVQKVDKFLDWLSSEGLLTDRLQSRNPVPGVSASLADLREGKEVGAEIPRSTLTGTDLFTNEFLSDATGASTA